MPLELTKEIVQRAVVERDQSAIGDVVNTLMPIVHANVARVLHRRQAGARGRVLRQEVEDLTHDVFERLLEDGGRRLLAWDPEQGSVSVFFGVVTQRCVHNILNSPKQSPWTEEPTEFNDNVDDRTSSKIVMEELIGSRDLLRAIGQRLVKGLGERDLKLFEMMYVRQVDDRIIQQRFGLSRDAVYQARRRLIVRTQKLAGDLIEEHGGAKRVRQ